MFTLSICSLKTPCQHDLDNQCNRQLKGGVLLQPLFIIYIQSSYFGSYGKSKNTFIKVEAIHYSYAEKYLLKSYDISTNYRLWINKFYAFSKSAPMIDDSWFIQ